VRGRLPTAGEGPPACPFVAFAEEPDSRAGVPDHRHRCYAQEPPEPRARAHQERFCLTSAFAGCAYFQDWAVRQAAERVPEPVPVGARVTNRHARTERPGRGGAGPGQLGAFDGFDARPERTRSVDRPYARADSVDPRYEEMERDDRRYERVSRGDRDQRSDGLERPYARVDRDDRDYQQADAAHRDYRRAEPVDRRYERADPVDRDDQRADPVDRRYERAEDDDPRYEPARAAGAGSARAAGTDSRLDRTDDYDTDWDPADRWEPPPEPRRERPRAPVRGGNGAPANGAPANGDERYSGYPTAARLLGIGSSPAYLPGGDELAEPGKWQRSERLQSWLEDAEQGARASRVGTAERDEWSESFAPVDTELEADTVDLGGRTELQAGVLPYRASQARRTPMPAPQRIGRQAARRGMPWERRATPETFPLLRPQQESRGRRFSPVLLAALALLLAAGVVFVLPTFLAGRPRQAAAPPTPSPTATVPPSTAPPSVAAATPRVYTVAKGDTIRGIAAQFKLTMDELLAANPEVTDPGRIRIGQKLVIPSPTASSPSPAL
jgi:LysM domain-containing protein